MRVFLAEELTAEVPGRYSGLIRSAAHCWTLRVRQGAVALAALQNSRWQKESGPLFESVEAGLGRWANSLVMAQTLAGHPLSAKQRALLSYGIEARLRLAAFGRAFLQQTLSRSGCRAEDVALDVLAADTYLRDSFRQLSPALRSLRFHHAAGSWPVRHQLEETVTGSYRLRGAALLWEEWLAGRRSRREASGRTGRASMQAAVFILNQRYWDLFQPVRVELESRGWRVQVFYYNPLVRPTEGAVPFDAAAGGSRACEPETIDRPAWVLGEEWLRESPVSRRWLTMALDASWVTAYIQVRRHLRVLEATRPAVVISFGPETMSLALQASAERLGIPSVFINHTFREPARSCWFLQATASTMFGRACAQANATDLEGSRRTGMVATGHPPYDAMLKRSVASAGRRESLAAFALPPDRPYLVLTLALWGLELVSYAMQERALKMLAEALPHNAFLMCKLHPSWEDRETCEAVLGAGLPRNAFRVVGEGEYRTPDLLAACDVAVMHEQSMSLTDAIVLGRPAIAIAHPELPCGSFTMRHPAWSFKGAWRVVNDSVELRQALVALTTDERARLSLLAQRRAYLDEFLVASDARAGRRVADLVEHMGAGGGPESFVPSVGHNLLEESARREDN